MGCRLLANLDVALLDCILGEGLKTARMRAHEHRVTLVLGRVHLCSESRDATRRYSLLLV